MKRRNPDDLTLLHRIRFKVRKYNSGITIYAYDGGDLIGMGKFFFGPFTDLAPHKKLVVSPSIIGVEKPWRRKGVASAIYRKVEELGYTIHPSSAQTPSGHKLWQGGRWGKREEVINSGILSRWKTEYARANPDNYDLVDLAVIHFGITSNRADVGYVLADGRCLDFAWNKGHGKERDHAEIEEVLLKFGMDKASGRWADVRNSAIETFMSLTGAARFTLVWGDPDTAVAEFRTVPTSEQVDKIASMCRGVGTVEIEYSGKFYKINPATAGRVRQVLEAIS